MHYTIPQYSIYGGFRLSCQFTSTNAQIADQNLKNECVFRIPISIRRNAPTANRTIPVNVYPPLPPFGVGRVEVRVRLAVAVREDFVEGDNDYQTGGLI